MTEQISPREPIRNYHGDIVFTSFQERPEPTFQLDAFHKTLFVASIAIAGLVPIFFALQTFGMTELLPVRYGITGEVLREGSIWEALGGLTLLGLGTIAIAVLARYPRIYNYPFMLTEHNAQRQYKNAVQMMVWIAFSMALMMIIMAASWLGLMNLTWIWVGLAFMVGAAILFIWRMVKLR